MIKTPMQNRREPKKKYEMMRIGDARTESACADPRIDPIQSGCPRSSSFSSLFLTITVCYILRQYVSPPPVLSSCDRRRPRCLILPSREHPLKGTAINGLWQQRFLLNSLLSRFLVTFCCLVTPSSVSFFHVLQP